MNPRKQSEAPCLRPLAACAAGVLLACASTAPPRTLVLAGSGSAAHVPEPILAMPVTPASAPTGNMDVNPFQGARFYVNPDYQGEVDATIAGHPDRAAELARLKGNSTALWIDSISAVGRIPLWLDDAAAQSRAPGGPVVPVFVVYDLPNRDCAANASTGELTHENGGEARYREEFIDAIAARFRAYPEQRIVVVLEPDSLPNLVTNLHIAKCALSEQLYKHSIAYAIATLSLPNVSVYLDAAHSGWLGWDDHRNGIARVFREVLDMAGGVHRIRGFATNVANYTTLSKGDGKQLEPSNPCPDELSYVSRLSEALAAVGITGRGYIVDTSRNGRAGIRKSWGNWCNIRGAGLGQRPTVAPAPSIDAYYWVKPPGESDGSSDSSMAGFDENCASEDAASGAPRAGQWFERYLLDLVTHANPPL